MRRLLHCPLAALLLFVGAMHFVQPRFFVPLMPPWLPLHAELVALSGAVEIVAGLALLVPRWRSFGGWLAFATLLAVWPANWHHALSGGLADPGLPVAMASAVVAWLRLPLQLPLLWWAWVIAREPRASAGTSCSRRARPSGIETDASTLAGRVVPSG